jgi:hypothetical protein
MVEAQVDGPGPVDTLIHAGSSRSIRTVKLRPKTALFAAFQKADVVRPFLNASDRKHVPGGAYGSSAYKSERCLCTGQFGTRRTQRVADPIDEAQFAFIYPNAVPGRAPGVDAPTRVQVYLLWRRIVLGPTMGPLTC